MTLQELFESNAVSPTAILIFFILVPLTAFVLGALTEEEERYDSPWCYVYSALVYLACVPGMLAFIMVVYTLLFVRGGSLVDLNVMTYFLPIISMVASIFVIRQDVDLDGIPGFNKIPGLLTMVLMTFLVILLIQKTRIWYVIRGSGLQLLFLFTAIFLLFRWGLGRFFSGSGSSVRRPSTSKKGEKTELW